MIGLREIRKEKHLNQQKVAMDLHITREALSHYENGRREPTLAMLVKMSEYFNVSIDYLLREKTFKKSDLGCSPGHFLHYIGMNPQPMVTRGKRHPCPVRTLDTPSRRGCPQRGCRGRCRRRDLPPQGRTHSRTRRRISCLHTSFVSRWLHPIRRPEKNQGES